MTDDRRWYLEPETFIAIAALIVSITAVVVGIYEAALQRAHDRAEVWPHVEIETFTQPASASIAVENGGIGPALVKTIQVFVDGKPRKNWVDVATAVTGRAPARYANQTIADQALHAGQRVTLFQLSADELPEHFWDAAKRIRIEICYTSVYEEATLVSGSLGGRTSWDRVKRCSSEPSGVDF